MSEPAQEGDADAEAILEAIREDDQLQRQLRTIVEPSTDRRSFLKGAGVAGAAALGAGGAAGGAAANTAGSGSLDVGSVTTNTYRVSGNRFGGPESARSELESELGSDDAGARFAADDTGAEYYWSGSAWELLPSKSSMVQTEEALSGKGRINNRRDHRAIANRIRQAAGVRKGETGPKNTPGLSDPGALGTATSLTVTQETDISGIAASGSGTRIDPYIVQDKDYTSGGVQFDDADGSYYVTFQNCELFTTTSFEGGLDIAAFGDATLRFENCTIYGSDGDASSAVRIADGGPLIELRQVAHPGGNSIYNFRADGEIDAVDIDINESTKNIGANVVHATADSRDSHIYLDRFDTSWNDEKKFLLATTSFGTFEIRRGNVDDVTYFARIANYERSGLAITHNYITNVSQNAIIVDDEEIRDFDFSHNTIENVPNDYRVIYIKNVTASDGRINFNHIKTPNKTTPPSGEEHIHVVGSYDVEVAYNWSEDSVDDAFEESSGGPNHFHHNVADRCYKSIVDIFGGGSPGTNGHDSGSQIHNIYGETEDISAVMVTDCNGVTVQDVVAKGADAAVELKQRFAGAGNSPDDCGVFGVLTDPEVTTPYLEGGDVGSNNRVVYQKDETDQDPFNVNSPWTDIR